MSSKKGKNTTPVNEFDETVAASKNFYEQHKKSILYGGGGLLAVVILSLLIQQFYIEPRNLKAQEALFASEALFAEGKFEEALNGDSISGNGFLSVIDNYSCTKSANLAKMYAGLCYQKLGNYEEAVELLEDFSSCGDEMISPAALGALGNCYVSLGNNEKGASTLEKAAKVADNNTLSPIFLLQAGQVYEELGKKDKAKACYEQIKAKYKQSALSNEIDKYLESVSE